MLVRQGFHRLLSEPTDALGCRSMPTPFKPTTPCPDRCADAATPTRRRSPRVVALAAGAVAATLLLGACSSSEVTTGSSTTAPDAGSGGSLPGDAGTTVATGP